LGGIRRAIIDRDVSSRRRADWLNEEIAGAGHDSGVVVVTTDDEPLIAPLNDRRCGWKPMRTVVGSKVKPEAQNQSRSRKPKPEARPMKSRRSRTRNSIPGNPTVEVDVVLDGGAMGRAAVPSALTGSVKRSNCARRRQVIRRSKGRQRQRRDRAGASGHLINNADAVSSG
jgi:hypothetical protein